MSSVWDEEFEDYELNAGEFEQWLDSIKSSKEQDDEEAYELLIAMGLPIRQKKEKIEESAEDTVEGIENTPAEMQDEDKADETPIDEVEMVSDVEDNKEEISEEEEETPEKGSNV